MWMNPYVQDALIRERIADAQGAGALRHLLRSARPATVQRRPWAIALRFFEAVSVALEGRKERMAGRNIKIVLRIHGRSS